VEKITKLFHDTNTNTKDERNGNKPKPQKTEKFSKSGVYRIRYQEFPLRYVAQWDEFLTAGGTY
jgi:hypothetical protein